jgi:hypothetical protein
MRLTGGVITYSERRTIAQYEHKDCKIELAFAFPEGDAGVPAFLDAIQAEIRSRCLTMLGLAKPVTVPLPAAPSIADAIPTVEAAPKPRKPRVAKMVVPDEDAPPADDEPAAASSAEVDEFGDPITAVKEISDKEMIDAITAKAKEIESKPLRKWLMDTYGVDRASHIPVAKRAECLAALKMLKK